MVRKLSQRLILLALLSIALSGCVFFESRANRQMEGSSNFKAGYSDGCDTASTRSSNYRDNSMTRDEELFRSDRAYRSGWSAGYSACLPLVGSQRPQNGPVADPQPGAY